VAAGAAVLALVLVSGGLLIGRNEAQQRHALTGRFDTRQATASRFIGAYVAGVFAQERKFTGHDFTGPISAAAFARTAADQGCDASVLVAADGSLLAVQPANPAVLGRNVSTYPHLRAALAGVPAVSSVIISLARGLPVVAFAVPFQTAVGRRVFSGGFAVEGTPLASFVRNVTPYRTARVLLVDAQGAIVASNRDGEAGRLLWDPYPRLATFGPKTGSLGSGAQQDYVTQAPVAGTT
jgi:hypothetical protein